MRQMPDQNQQTATRTLNPLSGQGAFAPSDAEGNSFEIVVRFLRKRGWIPAAGIAVGLLFGVAANLVMHKLYTATARIEIVPDISSQFRVMQAPDLGGDTDLSEKIDTEIAVLESRSLALQTIRALQLNSNQDFLPFKPGNPWDMSQPDVRDQLVGTFEGDLSVDRVGHTAILAINFRSSQPGLSSLVANALIDNYIEHSFRDNYVATAKVSNWLNSQLDGLKSNLEKSQAHMVALQQDLGIVGLDRQNSIVVANLEELNKQLADAQVDSMVKEARLQSLQSASPQVIDAGATVDPALQNSRQTLTQLRSQYTALVQTYGSAYPQVKSLKAQIDQLQRTLKSEERAQVERAQKELEAAQGNENMLRQALDKAEQDAFKNGSKSADYEFAKQDYDSKRLLYDGLQERLQEAGIMAGLHSTSIHIVDNADIPPYPSYPRTRINMAFGMGVGFFIALAIAFLLEALDTNLKTIGDIEGALQLPLLAAIPSVEAESLLPASFRNASLARTSATWSRLSEAIRGLRTSILLASPGSPPKTIMIASTRPSEGKSSIASLTAIALALNGARVLLIDADLRRPSVHIRFRMSKSPGLSSVLSGKNAAKDAILPWDELPALHVLPSGPIPPLPSELLGSQQMSDFLHAAEKDYDFILLDTPPVLAVTDASVLSRMADAVILVVRYGLAQRHVAQRCIDILDRSAAHLLGVVVNAVDFHAPEYKDYYGRKYYDYYGEKGPDPS